MPKKSETKLEPVEVKVKVARKPRTTANPSKPVLTAEERRLLEPYEGHLPPWRVWGPYVMERSWGSVREDYSPNGDAWSFLPHELARSKAYRWGEDGIGAICDRYQVLVLAFSFWNKRDPILKERMFGLTPNEGNHGEDVKEYYFYQDSTPTHSYMRMLYKYPQAEYPYAWLTDENRNRGGTGFEFELLDTGVFDEDRYFDVSIEYAKAAPDDICIRLEAFNRGPDPAPLHLIPQLWYRNNWAWTEPAGQEPIISPGPSGPNFVSLLADDTDVALSGLKFNYHLRNRYLYGPTGARLLFTNNETNAKAVFGDWAESRKPYVKDGFHRHIVNSEPTVNPEKFGTKSCADYEYMVPAGGSVVLRLRLTDRELRDPLADVDKLVAQRRQEADDFYETKVHPAGATADEKLVQRQALAGMFWSKAIYLFDVRAWLEGDHPRYKPPESRKRIRNSHWMHLNSMRVLSMPDKWEYPWFAAWDLAFHCLSMALADPQVARDNLWVMLFEQFQHPSGQIPAYEWEFSDLNPPVHAWACWRVYNMEKRRTGDGNREWLEKCFHKLLINFAWWVNRVDSQGLNVFEGGFLGLDNITVVDRSEKLPGGAILEQSDATGWMGFFCLNMMRIALELARENPAYEVLATKFFQHFIYIGVAMKKMGGRDYQLWDEEDGFFYDVLRYPDGAYHKFRVRSLVGLIPLYAVELLDDEELKPYPQFRSNLEWFIKNRPELTGGACSITEDSKGNRRYVLSIVDPTQLRRLLQYVWNTDEFLSDYGIRSLSKFHQDNPFSFGERRVCYEPAEADVKLKGGNSNWRGPIWFPTSFLMIESLLKFGKALGPSFSIEAQANPGRPMTPAEMANEVANRMIRLFTRNEEGRRPVYGWMSKFQNDPNWRENILFHEYFHGDNGAGLGANHQTGWTGLVANLIDEWRR